MIIPPHLTGSVSLLRTWLANESDLKPVVLCGSVGSGRHHWAKTVLSEYSILPVPRYDLAPVNTYDLAGRRRMAVRELSKWSLPDDKCIVIADEPPKQTKDFLTIGFPRPPLTALQSLCVERGVPESLATVDDNYESLLVKLGVYGTTGVVPDAEHRPNESWAEFKRGAKPPFDGPLLGYWLLSNVDPKYWRANRMLWLMYAANSKSDAKVPAAVVRMLMNAVRLLMPTEPRFPGVLKYKPAKSVVDEQPKAVVESVVTRAKGYSLAW